MRIEAGKGWGLSWRLMELLFFVKMVDQTCFTCQWDQWVLYRWMCTWVEADCTGECVLLSMNVRKRGIGFVL